MHIRTKKGFTLIELLIVVAIIGILAAVVVVGLAPAQRSGRDARRVADLKQVQTALELYYQKNQAYPVAAQCGTVDFSSSACWDQLSSALITAGVGITAIPDDPKGAGNQHYSYLSSSGSSYLLLAKLENTDPAHPILKSSIKGNGECGTAAPAAAPTYSVYCAGQ